MTDPNGDVASRFLSAALVLHITTVIAVKNEIVRVSGWRSEPILHAVENGTSERRPQRSGVSGPGRNSECATNLTARSISI